MYSARERASRGTDQMPLAGEAAVDQSRLLRTRASDAPQVQCGVQGRKRIFFRGSLRPLPNLSEGGSAFRILLRGGDLRLRDVASLHPLAKDRLADSKVFSIASVFVSPDDDPGNSPALPMLPWIQAGRTSTKRRAALRQKPSNAHLRLPATRHDESRPCH